MTSSAGILFCGKDTNPLVLDDRRSDAEHPGERFGRQHLGSDPVEQVHGLLAGVAAVMIDVVQVSLDHEVCGLRGQILRGRVGLTLHLRPVALVEDDEHLALFENLHQVTEVLGRQIAPPQPLAGLVVPATVVDEVRARAVSGTESEQCPRDTRIHPSVAHPEHASRQLLCHRHLHLLS